MPVLLINCSNSAKCDHPRQEPPSPSSNLHLFQDDSVSWQTLPPTSGPHHPIPPEAGIYEYQLSNLKQVAFLEGNGITIQYHPDISSKDLGVLSQLINEQVIIFPNNSLGHKVVATAWTWKLKCTEIDKISITDFIKRHSKNRNQNSHN